MSTVDSTNNHEESCRAILTALLNADPAMQCRIVDYISRDPDITPDLQTQLREKYDLEPLTADDADLPTLIAQWDAEEAGL
jgi:hypothetical protein